MANKQTAVEWLYQRLETMIPRTAIYNMDKREFIKQAKEMEKEQIKDAWLCGQTNGATICTPDAYEPKEKYYNKTYNVKDN
jgi:hypothetical protein